MLDIGFWKNRRVLLTGHTGFKGGWTALWLSKLEACVTGLALDPYTNPCLFDVANISTSLEDVRGDICDQQLVENVFENASPEIVVHMAAQPIVRRSYSDPVETYRTNVLGTAVLLNAARKCDSLKAIIVVTSDKCYENREWDWAYRETDALGGSDPYSNSKGCQEFVASSFRRSYFSDGVIGELACAARLATVRAGNVIGGGDWSEDRLVPDIVRALLSGSAVEIRNPSATRPWQHVLEPIGGYLKLAEKVWNGDHDRAFNFGPDSENDITVAELVNELSSHFPRSQGARQTEKNHPKEANFLRLDSSLARNRLNWRPAWGLEETLLKTAEWFNAWIDKKDMRAFSLDQISAYEQSQADLRSSP